MRHEIRRNSWQHKAKKKEGNRKVREFRAKASKASMAQSLIKIR
jgi:hypothetical protein